MMNSTFFLIIVYLLNLANPSLDPVTMDMIGTSSGGSIGNSELMILEVFAERKDESFEVEILLEEEVVVAFEANPGSDGIWNVAVEGESPFSIDIGSLLDQTEYFESGRVQSQVIVSGDREAVLYLHESESALYVSNYGEQPFVALPRR